MKYAKLGEINIPCIAIGTWSWGNGENGSDDVFGNDIKKSDLKIIFDEAIKNGFNLFDTAFVYGMGESEKNLGSLIKNCHKKVIVSTKFTPSEINNSDDLKKCVAGSLNRLSVDYIDIYWIHDPSNVNKWTNEIIPYIKENKVKYVGVSNHNIQEIKEAYGILRKNNIKLAAVQNHYSILYRESEKSGIIDWCHENKVIFFSYMVLEQGFLTGKYDENNLFKNDCYRGECYTYNKFKAVRPLVQYIKEVATKYGVSPVSVIVKWAMLKGTVPIIGVTKKKYIKDLNDAIDVDIKLNEIIKIEEIAEILNIDVRAEWE